MKKIAIILTTILLIPTVLCAKPFITTQPTTSAITHYIVTIDGAPYTIPSIDIGDGTVMLHYDLEALNLASGQHDITIIGINDFWGLETNPVPFAFKKPATLEDPAGIGLSAE